MAQITWSRRALDDLQSVFEFVSKDSDRYAERLVDALVERTEILTQQPYVGRMVPEWEDEAIRELIEGNYRIFYNVTETKDIFILRVHHSAQSIR